MTVQPLLPEDSEEECFASWAWTPASSPYRPWVWEHALMLADGPDTAAVKTVLDQQLKVWGEQLQRAWPTFLDRVRSVLANDAPQMWPYLMAEAGGNASPVCLELVWVDDASIQALNYEWRGKDAPTDVLTYSAIADSDAASLPPQLPGCPVVLGTVVLNVSWGLRHANDADAEATRVDWHQVLGLSDRSPVEAQQLLVSRYVLTRLFHGCLHVLGLHHDTDDDYARVVAIQDTTVRAALSGLVTQP